MKNATINQLTEAGFTPVKDRMVKVEGSRAMVYITEKGVEDTFVQIYDGDKKYVEHLFEDQR